MLYSAYNIAIAALVVGGLALLLSVYNLIKNKK